MDKKQLKRRKKILQDISRGRFIFYVQPLKSLQKNNQACVEVRSYYQTYGKIHPIEDMKEDLEKDMSVVIFDLYAFEKICEVIHIWRRKQLRTLRFHIQLSIKTMQQNDIEQQLEVIRNRYQVYPSDIGIIVSYQKHEIVSEKQIQVINQLDQLGYTMILESEEQSHLDIVAKTMFSMVKFEFTAFIKGMKLKRSMTYFYYILKWCREENVEIMFGGIQNEQQREYIQTLGCSYMAAPYIENLLALEELELLLIQQTLVSKDENRRG